MTDSRHYPVIRIEADGGVVFSVERLRELGWVSSGIAVIPTPVGKPADMYFHRRPIPYFLSKVSGQKSMASQTIKKVLTGSKNIGHSEVFRFACVIDVTFGCARGQTVRKTGMKAGLFQDAWE